MSRSDLYIVEFYESDTEMGKYQIIISVLIYLQMLGGIALLPIVKGLYRIPLDAIKKTVQ